MKDKILFWLDAGLIHFGIAKVLQEKHDADYYAIIDTNKGKTFFQNQKLVSFKKYWFIRDCFDLMKKESDLKYLKDTENKIGVNLWQTVYSDIIFNQYNTFHKFKKNKILQIFEQEIRFYERILDEIKPDFLVIRMTDYSKNQILHQLCNARSIPILTLGHTRLGSRCMITTETDLIEEYEKNSELKDEQERDFKELKTYIQKYAKEQSDFIIKYKNSTKEKISAAFYFFTEVRNKNYKNYYEHYGRTFSNLLKNEIQFYFQKKIRRKFIDNNAIRKTISNEKYVYFPLQYEPERSILIAAPFYTNQLEVIRNIAKSLPVNYFLYVKEHPGQSKKGWRSKDFYQKIIEMPNVRLIHYSISSEDLIRNASLVMTITGTAGLEAMFEQKPAIIFARTIYSDLPSVQIIQNLEELPKTIRKSLKDKVKLADLNNYVKYIEQNSFEFNSEPSIEVKK